MQGRQASSPGERHSPLENCSRRAVQSQSERHNTCTRVVYGPEELVVNQEALKIAVLESKEQWKAALCKDRVGREKEVCSQVI